MTDNQDNTKENQQIPPDTTQTVSQADFTALSKQIQQLTKQNADLQSKVQSFQPKEEPTEDKLTLKKMQEKFDRMEVEKQSETQKRRDMELRSTAKEELLARGVQPEMVKAAMAMLVDADKQIKYNEDGELKFYDSITGFEYDLKDGLDKWSKSNDAKGFLSGKNIVGAGSKPPKSNQRNPKMAKTDWETMLGEDFIRLFYGH